MTYTLKKEEKLKSLSSFKALFTSGKSVKAYPVRMVFIPRNNEHNTTQIAFSVPKKRFKNAVDRNRLKRQMREAYRLNRNAVLTDLQQTYAVVFIYLSNHHCTYKTLESAIKNCLEQLKAFDVDKMKNEIDR